MLKIRQLLVCFSAFLALFATSCKDSDQEMPRIEQNGDKNAEEKYTGEMVSVGDFVVGIDKSSMRGFSLKKNEAGYPIIDWATEAGNTNLKLRCCLRKKGDTTDEFTTYFTLNAVKKTATTFEVKEQNFQLKKGAFDPTSDEWYVQILCTKEDGKYSDTDHSFSLSSNFDNTKYNGEIPQNVDIPLFSQWRKVTGSSNFLTAEGVTLKPFGQMFVVPYTATNNTIENIDLQLRLHTNCYSAKGKLKLGAVSNISGQWTSDALPVFVDENNGKTSDLDPLGRNAKGFLDLPLVIGSSRSGDVVNHLNKQASLTTTTIFYLYQNPQPQTSVEKNKLRISFDYSPNQDLSYPNALSNDGTAWTESMFDQNSGENYEKVRKPDYENSVKANTNKTTKTFYPFTKDGKYQSIREYDDLLTVDPNWFTRGGLPFKLKSFQLDGGLIISEFYHYSEGDVNKVVSNFSAIEITNTSNQNISLGDYRIGRMRVKDNGLVCYDNNSTNINDMIMAPIYVGVSGQGQDARGLWTMTWNMDKYDMSKSDRPLKFAYISHLNNNFVGNSNAYIRPVLGSLAPGKTVIICAQGVAEARLKQKEGYDINGILGRNEFMEAEKTGNVAYIMTISTAKTVNADYDYSRSTKKTLDEQPDQNVLSIEPGDVIGLFKKRFERGRGDYYQLVDATGPWSDSSSDVVQGYASYIRNNIFIKSGRDYTSVSFPSMDWQWGGMYSLIRKDDLLTPCPWIDTEVTSGNWDHKGQWVYVIGSGCAESASSSWGTRHPNRTIKEAAYPNVSGRYAYIYYKKK